MSIALMLLASEIDARAFEKPADGVWKSPFWEVGEGFSVRVIAHAPEGGRAEVVYEWSPYEPTLEDRRLPDQDVINRTLRALELRAFLYYRIVYGFTPEGVERYT